MSLSMVLSAMSLLSLSIASSVNCTFEGISPCKQLTWCPCETKFFCAKLEVPLDYQNPSLGRASVPLIKYPAHANSSDGAYQGMILLNPGGPGGSGIVEARGNASTIQAIVGTNWDIVGFDPRGMWLSEPVVNCPVNATSSQKLELRAAPRVTDEFYNSYIDYGKELGQHCQETSGGEKDAGPHMSTAVTARDMASIADAFADTEDGKRAAKDPHLLNYYGISYGTFLGQTFASIFPEKVGNVVLDGVVSPAGYLNNFTYNAVNHMDGVLATFFIYCHEAGEDLCPYYTGSTPKDIFARFNQSFVQLDPRKAEAEGWANATDLELALLTLKVGILGAVESPISQFSYLSKALIGLEAAIAAQDVRPWTEQVIAVIGNPTPAGAEQQHPEWSLGVLCSDQNDKYYNKTLDYLRPSIKELEDQSIIGEVWRMVQLGCTGWPIKSKDIFTGPFEGDTATPILFVSNTYDPVTPIENSISGAPNYKDAQFLTVDGTGHTSENSLNQCGFAKIRAYYQNTELPGKDNFCPLEAGPFGITLQGTIKENIEKAGLSDLH